MKIAVIGATGLVGNAVVLELAARNHQVTAFARNIAKVAQHPNVQAVAADGNAPDFADKLAGFDAVVSAFKVSWDSPNLVQDIKTGYDNLLAAFKAAQLPYYLIIGGAGSLNVAPGLQLVDTPDFPAGAYPASDAVRVLLDDLRPRRDIHWAVLSPAALRKQARTAAHRATCCSTPTARPPTSRCPTWRRPSPTMWSKKRICFNVSPWQTKLRQQA